MERIFTFPVESPNEHYYYHIVRAVSKSYFAFGLMDNNEFFIDAFMYPSVKNGENNNICFQVEPARKKLALRGAAIATHNTNVCDGAKFAISASALRRNNRTVHYEPSEELCKFIIPNYSVRDLASGMNL